MRSSGAAYFRGTEQTLARIPCPAVILMVQLCYVQFFIILGVGKMIDYVKVKSLGSIEAVNIR